jgi:hypothetical protein
MVFLMRWFEMLNPDICKNLLGYSWQVFYEGKWCVLVVSKREDLPRWFFWCLADLLGERLPLNWGSLELFEQYLLALEKKYGQCPSLRNFVGPFNSFGTESSAVVSEGDDGSRNCFGVKSQRAHCFQWGLRNFKEVSAF